MLHRDIKADNILVTDDFEAKVADFGFSKQVANKRQRRMTALVFTHVGRQAASEARTAYSRSNVTKEARSLTTAVCI